MRKLVILASSFILGAGRVGLVPYIRYRLRSRFRAKNPIPVSLGGIRLLVRPGTPDLRVAFQTLGDELQALEGLLPNDFSGLIIDGGGYIGTAAIKLTMMYPRAVVVSVEPSTQNFHILRQNVALFPMIYPIQAALSVQAGQSVELVNRGTGEWGFSTSVPDANGSQDRLETVQTTSFADLRRLHGDLPIGIVKLDIEGGEHSILKSSDETLQKVPILCVELHDRIVPGCGDAFAKFCSDHWIVSLGGEKVLALRKSEPGSVSQFVQA